MLILADYFLPWFGMWIRYIVATIGSVNQILYWILLFIMSGIFQNLDISSDNLVITLLDQDSIWCRSNLWMGVVEIDNGFEKKSTHDQLLGSWNLGGGGDLHLKVVGVCAALKTPFVRPFFTPESHILCPSSAQETSLVFSKSD